MSHSRKKKFAFKCSISTRLFSARNVKPPDAEVATDPRLPRLVIGSTFFTLIVVVIVFTFKFLLLCFSLLLPFFFFFLLFLSLPFPFTFVFSQSFLIFGIFPLSPPRSLCLDNDSWDLDVVCVWARVPNNKNRIVFKRNSSFKFLKFKRIIMLQCYSYIKFPLTYLSLWQNGDFFQRIGNFRSCRWIPLVKYHRRCLWSRGKIPDHRNPPEKIAGVIDVFHAILNNLAKLCWLTALQVVCVNVPATRFHAAFNGPKTETSSGRRRWEEWGGRHYKRIWFLPPARLDSWKYAPSVHRKSATAV